MWFTSLNFLPVFPAVSYHLSSLVFSPYFLTVFPFPSLLLLFRLAFFFPPSRSPQPISASYEVWKMIICGMKWTEIRRLNGLTKWIATFLAIHHRSEATAVRICEGAGLLITGLQLQSVWFSARDAARAPRGVGERRSAVGGKWKGNAGACDTPKKKKNPPLIDFKWWNIDFRLVQGLAERAVVICRGYNAGHPFLLATISHPDTRKMRGQRRGRKRGRNNSTLQPFLQQKLLRV